MHDYRPPHHGSCGNQEIAVTQVKRIVCLANSRKFSERCVAGKELGPDGRWAWVRPVSARPSEAVSEYERQYRDRSDPQVLDIVEVPVLSTKPNPYQPENWLLDSGQRWKRTGRVGWNDLKLLADEPSLLWENGSSSGNGFHDRVPLSSAAQLGSSLYLLHLEDLMLGIFAPGTAFGNPKRRVQARFTYREVNYGLWVTDPVLEGQYLAGADGEFPIGECYITVSLGEPYEDGYCYKLVAAIITPQKGQA